MLRFGARAEGDVPGHGRLRHHPVERLGGVHAVDVERPHEVAPPLDGARASEAIFGHMVLGLSAIPHVYDLDLDV